MVVIDCGQELGRAAIDEPKHEHHAKLSDWIEDDFDSKVVDTDGLAEAVNALAKRWSRKPAAKRGRAT
jgi:hypothetical protein